MTLAINDSMRDNITVTARIIGPDEARVYLGRNTNNRKVRQSKVREFAHDMKNGRWIENGDTIRLDVNGEFLDGQHRMLAVIESNTEQRFLFVEGLQPESRKTMDLNSRRTAADAVFMGGAIGNVKDSAAIARGLLMYQNGGRPTHMDIVDFTEQHLDALQDAESKAKPVYREFGGGVSRYGVAAYVLATVDKEAAGRFMYLLATGDGLRRGNPIFALRSRLRNATFANNRDRGAVVALLELVFKAWNLWRAGQDASIIRIAKGESFPEPR